ncbi:fumarylpyruvate hydrolase [Dongia mobilis]|uniref:Fumarylpyruvate hydrolase n=1 Tax=Dongia mobilis TaxID=578943 RepID=A0A4R6WXU6_9PROT|nr:fumarylacetoacetate hydrolase family protein [Dongia mobilis]TDQ82445.1 fumarylpyruvate hydrolase [Dongia mobilis]
MTAMSSQISYAFPPHAVPHLPIRNSTSVFPVHRIYCVGRNYADHAIEMGHDPNREAPFFFQKNPDTLVLSGGVFPYPDKSNDVHHELEMVVALKSGGKDISVDKALDHVFGYAVGLDMTRRDLQGEAKKLGRPWEVGKAFEHSAPCSEIVPAADIGHPAKGAVWLKVNGVEKQKGDLDQLIWKVPEMIAYLSGLFELKAGDLIYSGTPAGVGPVKKGDQMLGGVEGIGEISIRVG